MTITQLLSNRLFGNFLALFSGLLLITGFAPLSYFPAPFFSITLLLALWLYANKRQAFIRGFLFGIGLYGIGISWVYISMHDYGNMSVALAVLFTVLFIMTMSLFPASAGYLLTRFFSINHTSKLLLAFPALWTLIAWTQSWIFSGFPWLDIGYTQLNSPLRGLAPYVGVYGITFAITLACGLIVHGALNRTKVRWYCAAAFSSLWAIGFIGGLFSWTTPTGAPVRVSLIQGNIPQDTKWQTGKLAEHLNLYTGLTKTQTQSQIIVWPEAAIPALQRDVKDYLQQLSQEMSKQHASLILGIPTVSPYGNHYFNSLLVIGNGYGRYDKRRLVPFGEFTPQVPFLEEFLKSFDIPMSDFSTGALKQPLPKAGNITLSPFICYESIFAEQVRNYVENAQALVVISDDSWFGYSWASDQHLQMTQMRALETGRFVLFSNNTSNSAIIDSKGHIIKRAPNFKTAIVTAEIVPMSGTTPWLLLGMNPLLLIILAMLATASTAQYQLRQKNAILHG